ncbi:MAG: lipoprotein-releasing ABC transporter permease subunit [Gammaproteobacteria bacterium]|nr:lipoprotein-releasing ABC transporter permease subunit [Gammaproteobacteria bacterium]MDH5630430.1 lipoprotein-releasing ABC transporter permease subunit [Gammaproteobacteria bacterium]
MKQSVSMMIGRRYTGSKKSNQFISFISLFSMIGIALGTIVLIVVMSVMNGFQSELQNRILGMVPHIVIGERGDGIQDWQTLKSQIDQNPNITASAPFIDAKAMFRNRGSTVFGIVQGVLPDEEAKVSIIDDFFEFGSLDDLKEGEFGIVLGIGMARRLAASIGDRVNVMIADGGTISPAGFAPRQKRFTIVGIFETKAEADSMIAMIHMKDAATLTRMNNMVSGLRLTTENVINARAIANNIRYELDDNFYVSDWEYTHGTLFRAIKMEKTMMGVLLTLIIAVAAFNIITTLVMVVNEKQADIAILRTLGATPGTIMKIFMIQGSINGLIGTISGTILGVLAAMNLPEVVRFIEETFSVSVVPGDVYFISFLPSELHWDDVYLIVSVAFGITFLATLYPSWKASKVNPAEALRYE